MNLTFDCRAKRNGKASARCAYGRGRQTDSQTHTHIHTHKYIHTHTHMQYIYVHVFASRAEYLIEEYPKQKKLKRLKRQSAAGC